MLSHAEVLGLRVHHVHVVGAVEHVHVVALSAFAANQFRIIGIAVVQDGATAVFGHDDVHHARFAVDGEFHAVSLFVYQCHVRDTVSYVYFHKISLSLLYT